MAPTDAQTARAEMFDALDAFVVAFKNYATNSDDFSNANGAKSGKGKGAVDEVTGKRKRVVKVKDPNQPKRPASSFLIYQIEKRQELKRDYPALGHVELTKLISETWNKMSEAEKKPYVERHAAADVTYKENLASYKATLEDPNGEVASPPSEKPVKKVAVKEKEAAKPKKVEKSKEIVSESEDDEDEDAASSETAQAAKDEIEQTSDSSDAESSETEEESAPPPKKAKAAPKAQPKKKK